MSAELVVLEASTTRPQRKARTEKLDLAARVAIEAIRQRAGWVHSHNEAHGADEAEREYIRFERAFDRLTAHYDSQIKTLERVIRRALDSDGLSDEHRAEMLGLCTSKRPMSLTDAERTLVEQYRRVDTLGRQAIRVVFQRVADAGDRSHGAGSTDPAGARQADGDGEEAS